MATDKFKRMELKYLITKLQQEKLLKTMKQYMSEDKFGKNTVNSLYYDTPNSLLIRHSMQKPMYKEKLRIRSYGTANQDSGVYIELKKKFKSVVYKRRVELKEKEAINYLEKGIQPSKQSQILKEIDYFRNLHEGLVPKMMISCDRKAYFAKNDNDFRVTFDKNILYREENLSLCEKPYGEKLIEDDMVLMEIKVVGGMPLWMTKVLTENKIFKTSFSKYGNAYILSKN